MWCQKRADRTRKFRRISFVFMYVKQNISVQSWLFCFSLHLTARLADVVAETTAESENTRIITSVETKTIIFYSKHKI